MSRRSPDRGSKYDRDSRRHDDYDDRDSRSHHSGDKRSRDSDGTTLALVEAVKRTLRERSNSRERIDRTIVEFAVHNARYKQNSGRFDIQKWKRNLPSALRNTPHDVLLQSMAYVNDPEELAPICQEKIRENVGNEQNSPSLKNAIQPIKDVERELRSNEPPDLFRAVRKFKDQDIKRAIRLFSGEIRNMVPNLDPLPPKDVKKIVEAIRQTKYELKDPSEVLSLVKVCPPDEALDYFKNLEKRDRVQEPRRGRDSPTERDNRSSRDRYSSSPPRSTVSRDRRYDDHDRRGDNSRDSRKGEDDRYASRSSHDKTRRDDDDDRHGSHSRDRRKDDDDRYSTRSSYPKDRRDDDRYDSKGRRSKDRSKTPPRDRDSSKKDRRF